MLSNYLYAKSEHACLSMVLSVLLTSLSFAQTRTFRAKFEYPIFRYFELFRAFFCEPSSPNSSEVHGGRRDHTSRTTPSLVRMGRRTFHSDWDTFGKDSLYTTSLLRSNQHKSLVRVLLSRIVPCCMARKSRRLHFHGSRIRTACICRISVRFRSCWMREIVATVKRRWWKGSWKRLKQKQHKTLKIN